MAYDATKVLWEGLNRQVSLGKIQQLQTFFDPKIARQNVVNSLKQPDFQTEGATRKIIFELSGDRQVNEGNQVVELVKIVPSRCKINDYDCWFMPLDLVAHFDLNLKCQP